MLNFDDIIKWEFARSGGAGGQNVNKVNTKATLVVKISELGLSTLAESRLRKNYAGHINQEDELRITHQESRSQAQNREMCLSSLQNILVEVRKRPKPRIATKPSRGARERRLEEKRFNTEKKELRRRVEW